MCIYVSINIYHIWTSYGNFKNYQKIYIYNSNINVHYIINNNINNNVSILTLV